LVRAVQLEPRGRDNATGRRSCGEGPAHNESHDRRALFLPPRMLHLLRPPSSEEGRPIEFIVDQFSRVRGSFSAYPVLDETRDGGSCAIHWLHTRVSAPIHCRRSNCGRRPSGSRRPCGAPCRTLCASTISRNEPVVLLVAVGKRLAVQKRQRWQVSPLGNSCDTCGDLAA